eukprot:PITA_18652
MDFPNLPLSLPITVAGEGAAIAAFVGLVFSFFFIWSLHKRRISARLPPGPFPWPIIGNLHQLILPAHRSLKDLADKYGPIFFLRLGSVPTVVVSSSEMAKYFLKTHDLLFSSRPPTSVGKYIFYNSKDIVFSPYGDHWRQIRKICVVQLLNAKRIDSFRYVREEEMSLAIRSIWEKSESGTIAVNVSKAISTLISNIVWRILASRKFTDNNLGSNFEGFKDLLVELITAGGVFNIGDFIPYLDCFDLQGVKRRMKKVHKTFDEFAEKIIDDHIAPRMATASNDQKEEAAHAKDFVDVLLQIAEADTRVTRQTIKAIVLDMFSGGVETTSTTLEWAMSELLRHPHAMKSLQEEMERVVGKDRKVDESDLASMKYLHCVVKETLRLYPAVALAIPHESVEAVTVEGYYIPKNTRVMVNLWAIGRDPNVWGADASEFKPERFMKEEDMNLTDQSDFSMIPFGAGRRGCPGGPMAIPTLELALAQLTYIFDWRVEGDPSRLDMKEASGLTIPRQVPLCAYPRLRVCFPLQTGVDP